MSKQLFEAELEITPKILVSNMTDIYEPTKGINSLFELPFNNLDALKVSPADP